MTTRKLTDREAALLTPLGEEPDVSMLPSAEEWSAMEQTMRDLYFEERSWKRAIDLGDGAPEDPPFAPAACEHPAEHRSPVDGFGWLCGLCGEGVGTPRAMSVAEPPTSTFDPLVVDGHCPGECGQIASECACEEEAEEAIDFADDAPMIEGVVLTLDEDEPAPGDLCPACGAVLPLTGIACASCGWMGESLPGDGVCAPAEPAYPGAPSDAELGRIADAAFGPIGGSPATDAGTELARLLPGLPDYCAAVLSEPDEDTRARRTVGKRLARACELFLEERARLRAELARAAGHASVADRALDLTGAAIAERDAARVRVAELEARVAEGRNRIELALGEELDEESEPAAAEALCRALAIVRNAEGDLTPAEARRERGEDGGAELPGHAVAAPTGSSVARVLELHASIAEESGERRAKLIELLLTELDALRSTLGGAPSPHVRHEAHIERALASLPRTESWLAMAQQERDCYWETLRWLVDVVSGIEREPPFPALPCVGPSPLERALAEVVALSPDDDSIFAPEHFSTAFNAIRDLVRDDPATDNATPAEVRRDLACIARVALAGIVACDAAPADGREEQSK